MELDYLKKDLIKSGNNIYTLLEGCLDCINEIWNIKYLYIYAY